MPQFDNATVKGGAIQNWQRNYFGTEPLLIITECLTVVWAIGTTLMRT